eukprot:TRINITY_DN21929_c0_g1_i1.p1 TRINITY_DN21929_c0_g1~~TRINITY_DN21929_c0_g1_i1.p1  ORF type:complete len:1798 (+),score=323.48 TRINITY_DN21929_c0_g1_i1:125-5518(+)
MATTAERGEQQLRAPLLGQRQDAANSQRLRGERPSRVGGSRCRQLSRRLGVRTNAEMAKVSLFIASSFLANTFFVLGRNVGTVLFLTRGPGAHFLTEAMILSGALTVCAGYFLSWSSQGVTTTLVYQRLLYISVVTFALLYFGVLIVDGVFSLDFLFGGETVNTSSTVGPSKAVYHTRDGDVDDGFSLSDLFAQGVFVAIYLAEDMLAMFIAMQCSTVAQAAFTSQDAKRLFGLVQLGNSLAAVVVGMSIGPFAAWLGTTQLLLMQVFVLALAMLANARIARLNYEQALGGAGGRRRKKHRLGAPPDAAARGDEGPWWHNILVLAMGFWSFSIIFAKTMYEYEYNVLAAKTLDETSMVNITGYLYAGAGLLSSTINLFGTSFCFSTLGVQGAILMTPLCLLTTSLAIAASPSILTTFIGRLVDLSLRWSINNSVRSVLWIAVPLSQALAAKPWVEGTVKKLASTVSAAAISVALWAGKGHFWALSICSVIITSLLLVCCVKVYALYLASMWRRIKRRELRMSAAPFLQRGRSSQPWSIEDDPNLSKPMVHRLLHAGAAEQLYLLREIGESLSSADWDKFFEHFYELKPEVQVEAVELGRKQRERISDEFLIGLIRARTMSPAVVTVAILAVGERGLHEVLGLLEARIAHVAPTVRAAAATAILRIGWGVGLGAISTSALLVLEQMLGFPLTDGGFKRRSTSCSGFAALALCQGGDENHRVDLPGQVEQLSEDWNAAIRDGDTVRAVALAIQLTFAKTAAQECNADPATQALEEGADSSIGFPGLNKLRRQTSNNSVEEDTTHLSPQRKRGQVLSPATSPAARKLDQREDMVEARWTDTATAIEMVQHLPAPRELIRFEKWVDLLHHPSHKVRVAALKLVREADAEQPYIKTELTEVVRCLCSPDTFVAAEAALWRLSMRHLVQAEVLSQLRQAADDYKRSVRSISKQAISESKNGYDAKRGKCDDAEEGVMIVASSYSRSKEGNVRKDRGSKAPKDLPAVRAMGLLKYLQRQCSWLSDAEINELSGSALCDELLTLCGQISEADTVQHLLSTVADLKARGFVLTRDLAEVRARDIAKQMLSGLVVQQWIQDICGASTTYERTGGAGSVVWPSPLRRPMADDEEDSVLLALQIALRYTGEHVFLLKLQLFQLAILSAAEAQSTTSVLAAWRVLRSDDAASQAAVLEVLESMLPPSVRSFVLPLLDDSPLDKKLEIAASFGLGHCVGVGFGSGTQPPPPWLEDWFLLPAERLGLELAQFCRDFALNARRQQCSTPVRTAADGQRPVGELLAKLILLSPLRLYRDLLVTHIAEIARIASIRHVLKGQRLCQRGETYVVASGTFSSHGTGRTFLRGDVVQELHALHADLEPWDVVCLSPGGATVLCIREQELFDVMFRLPPKFALGLLRSLIRVLPAPTQAGGSHTVRGAAIPGSGGVGGTGVSPAAAASSANAGISNGDGDGSRGAGDGEGGHEEGDAQRERAAEEYSQSTCELAFLARQHDGIGEGGTAGGYSKPSSEVDTSTGTGSVKGEQELDAEEGAENEDLKLVAADEPGLVQGLDEGLSSRGPQTTFTMLEKLVLLQSVKIFRYVTLEYLPAIASCCRPEFVTSGTVVFEEEAATNATLYIVAEGVLGLYVNTTVPGEDEFPYQPQAASMPVPLASPHPGQRQRPHASPLMSARPPTRRQLQRQLRAGDSVGNTGLLLDSQWSSTAVAMEDTWLLCLSRSDLTDLLRGRRELASDVIRGLYRTFLRRMQQVDRMEVAAGNQILASPMVFAKAAAIPALPPPPPFDLPPPRDGMP